MAITTWQGAAKVAWRARHLPQDPWDEVENVLHLFRAGIAYLVTFLAALAVAILAAFAALLVEAWRTEAILVALAAAIVSLSALLLGLRLLLFSLPRQVRALATWAANAPHHAENAARELQRIVTDVEAEERTRR